MYSLFLWVTQRHFYRGQISEKCQVRRKNAAYHLRALFNFDLEELIQEAYILKSQTSEFVHWICAVVDLCYCMIINDGSIRFHVT